MAARMGLPSLLLLAAVPASAKDAFVFLGATGDNALRPNGVWQGVFEAYSGGEFDQVGGVDIHVAMNTPHTVDELQKDVRETLSGLYTELQATPGWKCAAKGGDCDPEHFLQAISVNIWPGRDANAQAANMTASLLPYEQITLYLSIPPEVFGTWSKAAVDNWGQGSKHRVHVAAEKPFGTSLEDADKLHQDLTDAGVPESNLHLVDHWLSFFMNRHLPQFRAIVQPRLAATWGAATIEKVVVTEFETRGLDGRGGFFDGVGQVRDMVQSHLLQVLLLSLIDPASTDLPTAKLAMLNRTTVTDCALGQYDGFLLEPKLSYHASFADATFCAVTVAVDTDQWRGVPMVITTGKDMGTTLYTVEFFQKGGPGVLTFEIGKEETGLGGIKVQGWPLLDSSAFDAPLPGFRSSGTVRTTPAVSGGNGYILNYSDPNLYFPKPYALMAAALLTHNYGSAFVTYPECRRSWQVVTADSPTECLNPVPKAVPVYQVPSTCGNTPPQVCWENRTVQDFYDDVFSCTPEHDTAYVNISLYQAKCHPHIQSYAIVV